jgi:excinuclease UvrABC ATPase subunit
MATDIRIVGARENNLDDVTLTVPAGRITAFVGVSGSGKSSLVFDTLAVEAQRQLNATFPWSIRAQLPKYERPHVDAVEHLTAPVVVDQRPLDGNARSTVGTISDVYAMLRTLFARHAGVAPSRFSFNDPRGMCPVCDGIGRSLRPDPDLMLDKARSLNGGALLIPGYSVGSPRWQAYGNYTRLDPDKPIGDYSADELRTLLYGGEGTVQITFDNGRSGATRFEGLLDMFARRYLNRDAGALSEKTQAMAARFISEGECAACGGTRLGPDALATTIGGRTIAQLCAMQISDLVEFFDALEGDAATRAICAAITAALRRIDAIGLGYLSLDRPTPTLSGGEGQRLKLVKHLGSDLTGLTYIFDEPSVGLHPRDVGRLNDLLRALRDKGNTVLVVEHDPDVIAIADHVVELGPRAGAHGGRVVFEGSFDRLRAADTVTGRALRRGSAIKDRFREPTGRLPLRNVDLHNLKGVSVDFPTGVLTVVTGVAGSGKSSLVSQAFRQRYPDTVAVDQSPIRASSRSTPATYLGAMDPIRKLFAKASGADAGLFSFNSAGACEDCQGRGVIITELAYLDPVTTHCEGCDGRRFKEDVLAHKLRGKSIADVLELPAREAADFFTEKAVAPKLHALIDTGLGYLRLGQSLSSLSGGERQRIKLADQLAATGTVYVLDEPTTGLHLEDIDTLLSLLNSMVERGNTVIVVEHNLALVAQADWIIDLGPDGGKNGGEIIFTGTPEKLLTAENSLTADHLRRHLAPTD